MLLPFAVATTADAQSNLVIVRVLLGTFRLPDAAAAVFFIVGELER